MSDSDFESRRKIDSICNDFEAQWSGSDLDAICTALDRIEAEHRDQLLQHLLAVEVELRSKAGESITPKDYEELGDAAVQHVESLLTGNASFQSLSGENQTQYFEQDSSGGDDEEDETFALKSESSDGPTPTSVGRYQIESVLGKGGFGLVYKAYDEQLQRHVAVKVPHAHLVHNQSDAEAYLTEARTVANLDHPNIVPVHDVGRSDEFPCYVVSRFIEGTDLSDRIKKQPLSIGETVELVATIAEALHYAHKQGLVHRDVKSGNILLGVDGKSYLVDFGLALKEQKVGTGAEYAGTPAYMSPEQARGEGHRVDGRSDIYSLGVVLYELLTGKRTFRADTARELLSKISSLDVKPPRQINDSVPRELERICLKALSRRSSDRYTTALDLADDVRHFLKAESAESLITTGVLRDTGQEADSTKAGIDSATPKFDSDSREIRVVPKGLRSFDAHDADFFLELLPGPRDRDGLPDSIRFWKTTIEETDSDHTFSIGLIYGPSGCGKSSLVKAGLLPRLSENVIPIYIEATPDETESRLLNGLRKACPRLDPNLGLVDSLTAIRQGTATTANQKVLVVMDQFEQWLHAKKEDENTELVQALRQCDGGSLQCIVMVRDDFWMAVTRFLDELEIELVQGQNFAAVDLFPIRHAEKVLAAFGRAFRAIDENIQQPTSEQKKFISQSVAGLAEEGKVICVRLALFAEMMKGKEWTIDSLTQAGGTSGVGVTFLEETFNVSSAPPKHRLHQKAARGVLKALLPDSGTDIKGEMKSREELMQASGYASRPKDFDDLIRILDSEIRLITPTDPEGSDSEDDDAAVPTDSSQKYYQLTHDYLVPSLRDWLTRKQRETRRGRAELLLAERTATWTAKPENRQLPSTLEWLRIQSLTSRSNWTGPQRKMIQRANRVKGIFWTVVVAVIVVSIIRIQQFLSQNEQRTLVRNTKVAVESLQGAEGKAVPYALENLDKLPQSLVVAELKNRVSGAAEGQQKISLLYGVARYDQVEIDAILDGLLSPETEPDEVDNIVDALGHDEAEALKLLNSRGSTATTDKDWNTKVRLAVVGLYLGDESLAAEMLRDQPEKSQPKLELPDLLSDFQKQVEQITALPKGQRYSATRISLARAYYFLGEYDKALVELDLLASGESANWEVWLRRAVCQAHAGRDQDSKKSLAELAKATRTESLVTYGQILVEAGLGNMDEAENQLTQMISASPQDSTAQYNAACIAAQLVDICRRAKSPDESKFKSLTLRLLRTAYQNLGYKGSSGIDNDADFIPLHQDQDFLSLVAEIKPPAIIFDPIERTVFIREFAQWSGSVDSMAEILANTDDSALRSGICLSLGSVNKPGQAAKAKWQPILASWYTEATDNGTHSASGWALSQWSLETPEVAASKTPLLDRAWWHEPNGLKFVKLEAGSVMGEEGPIKVQDDFWLSDSEITVGLFRQFMADEEYHEKNRELKQKWDGPEVFNNDDSADLPVQEVSWYEAVLFCNWLSDELGLDPCYAIKKKVTWKREANGIRLPTEAEWEYGCRATTTTRFSFGDDESALFDYGWFVLNSNSRAHTVGEKLCNAWGLFDMHGNVWEWCWDPIGGSVRVDRGGGLERPRRDLPVVVPRQGRADAPPQRPWLSGGPRSIEPRQSSKRMRSEGR